MEMQKAANQAVLDGLAAYERRHGWRSHPRNVIAEGFTLDRFEHPDWDDAAQPNEYWHALVVSVSPAELKLKMGRYSATLVPADAKWTGRRLESLFAIGDLAYVKILFATPDGKAEVSLEEDSGAQAALMAIDNATGEIKAMVGGREV